MITETGREVKQNSILMCNRIHTSCKAPAGSTPPPGHGERGVFVIRHLSSVIFFSSFVIVHSSLVLLQRFRRSGEVAAETVASEDIFRQERFSLYDQANQIQGDPRAEHESLSAEADGNVESI